MKRFLFLWIGSSLILILIAIILVTLFVPVYNYLPISNRLENSSYFATCVYTIITGITLLLIYFSFQETQKQTFDTTFFKFLETHRSIIDRLQHGKLVVLNESFKQENDAEANEKKDFFDVLYNILDSRYKKNLSKPIVKERIEDFFKDYYYMIDHCVRNFISIIQFVDKSKLLNKKQKNFYVGVLRDMSTIDDLRFLIYTIIWRSETEGKEWKRLFDKYKIPEFIGNNKDDKQLIIREDDWRAYQNI